MFSIYLSSVEFIKDSCAHSFETEEMQKFIHSSKHRHFDLVLMEDLFTDSFLMFGHLFNAPVAVICEFQSARSIKVMYSCLFILFCFKAPYGVNEMFDIYMGLVPAISHVPSTILPYTEDMDFFQRWYNAAFITFSLTFTRLFHVPWHTEIIKKNFAHLESVPTAADLRKNVSIYFVNAHRSISYPRPSV